jgi:hypothetical protein
MLRRLTECKEWKFFAVLPKADPVLAAAWWLVLLSRGILPAVFAIAMGVLVSAVQHGQPLVDPLAFTGATFVLLQVLSPGQVGRCAGPALSCLIRAQSIHRPETQKVPLDTLRPIPRALPPCSNIR